MDKPCMLLLSNQIQYICMAQNQKKNHCFASGQLAIGQPLIDGWNIYLNIYCGMMCTREPSFMIFRKIHQVSLSLLFLYL